MTLTAMPKYEAYWDSKIEWIGDIPKEWELTKLGACLTPVSIKNRPDLPLLSITRELGVIERDIEDQDSNHNFIPDDLSGYKVIESGQFGMNKMKAWQGSYGVSKYTGIVSPAYYVFKFEKDIDPDFFHWAIRSHLYISFFASASDGVRIGQWDLSKDRMKEIPFVYPQKSTQTAIANFLDAKTTQIDEAIAIKEQQIALLNERKQILIQQAVIKGLNQNVPMKKSGVDWVGDIPEHWSLQPGFIVFNENKKSNKGMIESQVLSLSYGKIIVKAKEKLNGLVPESFETYQVVSPGNIIIRCTDLQNDKTSLRTGFVKNHGIITSAYLCLNISLEQNAEYIHYFLHALDVCKEIYRYGSGLRQSLSFSDFKRMLVITPPIEEQDQIVTFIREQEENIMSAVELLKAQIEKLTEYKKSLIHSAVTGNIKVV